MRLTSPLIAVFLLAGLVAQTDFAAMGTAKASAAGAQERGARGSEQPETPATLEALGAALDAEVLAAPEPSEPARWRALIDARLAALRPGPRDAKVSSNRRLRLRVEEALASAETEGRVAFELRDLDSGEVLLSRDEGRTLNPASNQKLVTAIAAVELLGADYRFETAVYRQGDALVIRGEGDPDLHVHDLHALASHLASQPEALEGVRRVIVDDTAFDARQLGPGFRSEGPGESYIAPSGALALDYGTVAISVTPTRLHADAAVHVEPAGAAVEIRNRARTGPGRIHAATRTGDEGRTIVEVGGAIPGGHAPVLIRRRVADPGLVAGGCFAELLAQATGRAVLPVERGELERSTATRLAVHDSAPLRSVLGSALRYSNNFTAEQILRTLAWRATGEPGSWDAGVTVLERFAAALSPGQAEDQRFVNGSGLSLEGRLSPRFVVDVLALSTRPGSPSQTLLASFASAGGEGTLHARLPHAGDRVLAKTGTYAGASTLSGVVRSAERRVGFSILINGAPLEASRAAQDRVVAAILRAL